MNLTTLTLIGCLVVLGATACIGLALPNGLAPLAAPTYSAGELLVRRARSVVQSEDAQSGEFITSTDMCNEIQYDEFAADFDVCFENANQDTQGAILNSASSGINLARLMCDNIQAKAKCFTDGGPRRLQCWNREESEYKKLNYLFSEYKDMTNETTSLSALGITKSCPAFGRQFEQDIMTEFAGSTRCRLDAFLQSNGVWKKCNADVAAQRDALIDIAIALGRNGKEIFFAAHCNAKRDWSNKCNRPYFTCFSPAEKQKLIDNYNDSYAKVEQALVNAGFIDFSFATTC